MVKFHTPKETIELCIQPYAKALDIQYPIHLTINNNRTFYAMTSQKEDSHLLSFDPELAKCSIDSREIFSAHTIRQDENKLSDLVSQLCFLHLSEKIHRILSPMYAPHNNQDLQFLSLFHNSTVKIWSDDILHRQWPDLFVARYERDNKLTKEGFEEANDQSESSEWRTLLFGAAILRANAQRHDYPIQDKKDAFSSIEQYPRLAKHMTSFIEEWSSLQPISYNPENDMENYEKSVKRVVGFACLNAEAVLKEENGSYQWFLDIKEI